MTNKKAPRLVVDAQSPWAGGDLFTRSASGSSTHQQAPLVYCHICGQDGREDVWSCASTAADAVAESGDFYRTKSPPEGALKL